MSFFSIFKNEKEEVALLIDIGNGSVTGALTLFKKNEKPEFLFCSEIPFTISEKPNASKLVDDMVILLNILLENITKQGFKHPYWEKRTKKIDGALVTFSSPWFVSKTKHVTLSKDSVFIITRSFIDDIIKNEEEVFQKELTLDNTESNFKLVEKSIVHTKINGYTLEDSIGKKTKSLDAFLYMSLVSEGIINKVDSIISKSLHIPAEKIIIHTFPLVSFTVIRDVFSASSDFIIMDITGEVTDLTLVQSDVIKQSVSIPSGRNFIIRQIVRALGVTPEIAESTLHLYSKDMLDQQTIQKMEEVLVNVEKEWSIYLENGLSELSSNLILPGNIYLTVDEDVAPIYINFLKLSKTDSTAMFRKSIQLNRLDREAVSGFLKQNMIVKTNEFVSLLAIFYQKIISV